MDGQAAMQIAVMVRTAIDTVRSLLALRPSRRLPDGIPVYRLVTRDQLLLTRSEFAFDVVRMRWPR